MFGLVLFVQNLKPGYGSGEFVVSEIKKKLKTNNLHFMIHLIKNKIL